MLNTQQHILGSRRIFFYDFCCYSVGVFYYVWPKNLFKVHFSVRAAEQCCFGPFIHFSYLVPLLWWMKINKHKQPTLTVQWDDFYYVFSLLLNECRFKFNSACIVCVSMALNSARRRRLSPLTPFPAHLSLVGGERERIQRLCETMKFHNSEYFHWVNNGGGKSTILLSFLLCHPPSHPLLSSLFRSLRRCQLMFWVSGDDDARLWNEMEIWKFPNFVCFFLLISRWKSMQLRSTMELFWYRFFFASINVVFFFAEKTRCFGSNKVLR